MAYPEKIYAEAPSTRPSPFAALTDAVAHLQKAEAVASELADRIAGSAPRPVSTQSSLTPGANGLLDSLDSNVAAINEAANSIIGELQRIERRL